MPLIYRVFGKLRNRNLYHSSSGGSKQSEPKAEEELKKKLKE